MRIAFSNQKGGVSKTTDTIHTAGALAARDNRVLVVDGDSQGHLTNELGLGGEYTSDDANLYDALKDPTDHDLQDLITPHPEFDVVPSNIDMFRLVQDLIASGWRVRERLDMLLDGVDHAYDYILIDAPPSLNPINDNILLAAENILIPVEAEESSELALTHLFNQINTLEERYDAQISELGLVISNVEHPLDNDQRSVIHGFARDFRDVCPVYEVRNRAAIKRCKGSLFGPGAVDTDQKRVFEQIAISLEERNE